MEMSARLARSVPIVAATVPAERDYYSIAQAATLLGVSRVSIWRWIRDGQLPALRLGHRTTRIKRQDLDQFLTQGMATTVATATAATTWEIGSAAGGATIEVGAAVAPRADGSALFAPEHVVQFYETDAFLLDALKDYIGAALRTGDAGIVVATQAHRAGLEEHLRREGLDVDGARARGRYVALDAAETLGRFMVDGAPDATRFEEVIGGAIARASQGCRVRLFGEMVALLAIAGNYAAAVRLEEMWNDLHRKNPFTLMCAYPLECLSDGALSAVLGDVCAQHAHVFPAESYMALPTVDERLRAVAVLQHKASALAAALAAEASARQAAEAALRVRDEFLSIAAHELRSPLTSLVGHTQLALRRLKKNGGLEPEQVTQALETMGAQAERLSRLVSRLLDTTRLESGKLTLEREPADLAALVAQVVAVAQTWSERHSMSVVAPPSLEAVIDPLRLEQVLTNLLDNAVKYCPDGGPIEVTLIRVDEGTVELAVRDHGPGIPDGQRGQIFERFYQAPGAGSGLGLGLYVSRQIVELHGGELHADCPPDGGTRFAVRLPIALAERAAISSLAVSRRGAAVQPATCRNAPG